MVILYGLGLVSSIGLTEVEFGCVRQFEVLYPPSVLVLKMTYFLKIKYFAYIATTPYRADKGVVSPHLNTFLDKVPKLRKSPAIFVMSLYPSAWNNSVPT